MEVETETTTDLALVWVSPSYTPPSNMPFGKKRFKRELYVKALTFNHPLFNNPPAELLQYPYIERALETFKTAFKNWITLLLLRDKDEIIYREMIRLAWDRTSFFENADIIFNVVFKEDIQGYARSCEFLIEDDEVIRDRAREYIINNICYLDKRLIYDSLENYTVETAPDALQQLQNRYKPEKRFEATECPVCITDFENNEFIGKCGHLVCSTCIKPLTKLSNNCVCPVCRDDWNVYKITNRHYDLDDIEELCDECDADTLLSIISIDSLLDIYEDCEWEALFGDYQGLYDSRTGLYYSIDEWNIATISNLVF